MTYSEIEDLINENLASGIKIPAVDHREVEMALLNYINDNLPKQFDIKYIYADSTYLGDNFETNGLGKNLRLGWAICNGNNGTPNIGGRMIVSYGGDFTTLNEIGGSKDSIIPAHDHKTNTNINFGTGDGVTRQRAQAVTGGTGNLITTETVGESGEGKNIPPYITLVAIMKL